MPGNRRWSEMDHTLSCHNSYDSIYTDVLSKYVQEMLLDPLMRSQPYLDREGWQQVQGNLRGECNHIAKVHSLLLLELLDSLFIQGSANRIGEQRVLHSRSPMASFLQDLLREVVNESDVTKR